VQPVKRFSRFQSLSPWRSRTSVCTLAQGSGAGLRVSVATSCQLVEGRACDKLPACRYDSVTPTPPSGAIRMLRTCVPLALLVLPWLAGLHLLGDPPAANGVLAFQGATIHTATGKPLVDGVLVIEKGKIVAVGDSATPIPKGARVIDARGK